MSLDLDARQRAMLQEMGVRVWQPEPATAVVEVAGVTAPTAVPAASAPARTAPRSAHSPTHATHATHAAHATTPATQVTASAPLPLQHLPKNLGAMDWPALQEAVVACQACGLCAGRKNAVFGSGDGQAHWMIVGDAPSETDDLQGEPFVGEPRQLLDNMLKAVGISRSGSGAQGVFLANAIKCRPPSQRSPQPDELAQCEPYLRRQVALLQPKVIFVLGRTAAQSLLQASVPEIANLPLGKLRSQVHSYQGIPVVVSYPLDYLLRAPVEKAKAWADLCLALDVVQRAP